MALLLFVAELGSGFGHVRRLLPLARAAATAGHRPVFFVPNPAEVRDLVSAEGFEVVRAPAFDDAARRQRPRDAVATSFADILGSLGFSEQAALLDIVQRWDRALDQLGPAAVICEHSPFLALACVGGDTPVLSLGHGFILPPPDLEHFPPLTSSPPLYQESELLDAVTLVGRHRERPTLKTLPSLLLGTAHAVTGLDVLDPYRGYRRQPAVGPPALNLVLADQDPSEDVFAYLLGDAPETVGVLAALARLGTTGRAYVRRGTEAHRQVLAGSPLVWLQHPESTSDALARARAIVHHGSMSMAEESLISGKPQVVVPLYLEHLLTTRALLSLGVAAAVRPSDGEEQIQGAVSMALMDTRMSSAASSFSNRFWQGDVPSADLPRKLLAQVLDRNEVRL